MRFFEKVHELSTYIAVFSIVLCTVLVFLWAIDDVLRLNVLPQSMEMAVVLGGWAFGSIAFGSSLISVLLSLFFRTNRE